MKQKPEPRHKVGDEVIIAAGAYDTDKEYAYNPISTKNEKVRVMQVYQPDAHTIYYSVEGFINGVYCQHYVYEHDLLRWLEKPEPTAAHRFSVGDKVFLPAGTPLYDGTLSPMLRSTNSEHGVIENSYQKDEETIIYDIFIPAIKRQRMVNQKHVIPAESTMPMNDKIDVNAMLRSLPEDRQEYYLNLTKTQAEAYADPTLNNTRAKNIYNWFTTFTEFSSTLPHLQWEDLAKSERQAIITMLENQEE